MINKIYIFIKYYIYINNTNYLHLLNIRAKTLAAFYLSIRCISIPSGRNFREICREIEHTNKIG